MTFGMEKNYNGLATQGEKKQLFIRFDRIHERDGRTDRQTRKIQVGYKKFRDFRPGSRSLCFANDTK